MRKWIFRISLIAAPLTALIVLIVVSYAWYVNVMKTGSIDASTKNVAISYEITNGNSTSENVLSYTIDNLAFFDVDSEDETKYFNTMALAIELKLTNKSSSDMTYTVKFSASKIVDEGVSVSYVACYFKNITSEETIEELKTNTTIAGNTITYTEDDESFVVECKSAAGALKEKNEGDTDEVTLTLYLIGVQEIDSATNTDFLYKEVGATKTFTEHSFTLQIKGEPLANSTEEEIQQQ